MGWGFQFVSSAIVMDVAGVISAAFFFFSLFPFLQSKARVEAMTLDLASLRSVREFAEVFKARKL